MHNPCLLKKEPWKKITPLGHARSRSVNAMNIDVKERRCRFTCRPTLTVAACVGFTAESLGRPCRLSVEMESWESRATNKDNGCKDGEPLTGGEYGGRLVNRFPCSSRMVEVKVRYLVREQ